MSRTPNAASGIVRSQRMGLLLALVGLNAVACHVVFGFDEVVVEDGGGGIGAGGMSRGGMGAGGNGEGGGGHGEGGDGEGGVTYTGTLVDGFTGGHLDGAELCGLDPMLSCVATNASGEYRYSWIPEDTRVRIGATLNGYFPIEALIDTTQTDGELSAFMISEAVIAAGLQQAGATFDNSKAIVSISVRDVRDAGLEGYTVDLSAMTGLGPVFYDGMLGVGQGTTTTDSGLAFYVNVEPGDYEVTVSGPLTCTSSLIGEAANTHPAPLINAAQFVVQFTCE